MFEGQFFFISAELIRRYTEAFPGVSIVTELKKMECWLEANPDKRKRQYRRFVVNWLSRAHSNLLGRELEFMLKEDMRRTRIPL